jgi:hypothetical protein
MLNRIDASERLSVFLVRISSAMARLRGLPLLAGTGLLILSFLTFGFILLGLVVSDHATSAWLWLCLPITLLHIALFAFFTGVMLSVPLGEGYQDNQR